MWVIVYNVMHTISLNLDVRYGIYYTHSTDEEIKAPLFNREWGLTQILTLVLAPPSYENIYLDYCHSWDNRFDLCHLFIDCFKVGCSAHRLPWPTLSILTSPSSQRPQHILLTSPFGNPSYSTLKQLLCCYSPFNMFASSWPQLVGVPKKYFLPILPIFLCRVLGTPQVCIYFWICWLTETVYILSF